MLNRLMTSLVLILAMAGPLSAQTVGVRAGVSGDPDQFFVGGHMETRPLAERITFRPNVEVGIGDDHTLVAVNLELAYTIPLDNQPWSLYVGGGPAANFYSARGRRGDGDIGGGFNFLLGAQHRGGLFGELKVGAIDSPNIKLTIGFVFR